MNGRLDVDATQELPIIGYEPAVNSFRVEPERAPQRPRRTTPQARPVAKARTQQLTQTAPTTRNAPASHSPRSRAESAHTEESKTARKRKVSKWDRPPPPKDWRYFVGGLGQIFIALGLLTFGFVGYQLWGTGIETARTQNELGSEFQQQLTDVQQRSEAAAPEAAAIPVAEIPEEQRPVDPEITEVIPAEEQSHLEIVDPGKAVMKMEIPKIGVDSYVMPTVTRDDLKKGVGHFPETGMAGQLGNAAFAGHRTTYGGPFYHLDKLEAGDRVVITRLDGNRYTYAVTDTEVVDPDTFNINNRLDPQVAQMTLMTCTPIHSAVNRLIIYGELVPSESGPVGEATFYKLRTVTEEVVDAPTQTTNEVLADEVATLTENTAVGADAADTAPPTLTESTEFPSAEGVDTADATASDEPITDEAAADELEADDTWSGGWFEDKDAWPQIAAWGAGVLGMWILFRLISRWTRHYSIGFMLCVAPFLVCLYFFYQNVNRLLPPGI